MNTIRLFLPLTLCLCSICVRAQFSFNVNEVLLTNTQFTITINLSDKLITATNSQGISFSHNYYDIIVSNDTIGFALNKDLKPILKFQPDVLCFIINASGMIYNNPKSEKAYKFTPTNIPSFTTTYNSFISAIKGGNKKQNNHNSNRSFMVKGVSFTMIYVQGGTFQMGSNDGNSDEKPVHEVNLSDYFIGQTEVTQELWQTVMGSNPSRFIGEKLPVECVSWFDCQEFIRKLNSLTGEHFRLPTEAEWEFAARGGNKSQNFIYSGSSNLDSVAWVWMNCGDRHLSRNLYSDYELSRNNLRTHNVSTKHPNELGIYDMSGNVLEWCDDYNDEYSAGSQTNPKGSSMGTSRNVRGGCWMEYLEDFCRVSARGSDEPHDSFHGLGFRIAL